MPVTVTTHYLEMTDRGLFRPRIAVRDGLAFRQVDPPSATTSKHWYVAVGDAWHWRDRLIWSAAEWESHVRQPTIQTWVAFVDDQPAGYAELEQQPDGNVEIAYFGLLQEFVGQGLGGHFLSETVARAWAMPARRVWVHTCSLDHPAALANYLARGFVEYKVETAAKSL